MDTQTVIRLFIRLVESGSFSKAAAEMGMGQPSATKAIAKLEEKLGARLLYRSTQGVQPTEIGGLYYEKCRVISHHLEEAENLTTLLQTQVQGVIRLSTSVAFGRRVLAPMLLKFMAQNPKIQIDLSFEDRYVNLVEQGIDLAIRIGHLADSGLGAKFLGTNPWVIVASPAYLSRHGSPQNPSELETHAALIYSTVQGDARWHFLPRGQDTTSVKVQGPLRSNNLSTLLMASIQGFGVAALPHYMAQKAIFDGTLVEVLQSWSMPSQEIHAVYPSPRMLPHKVKGLIDWLQTEMQQDWWLESLV
jgi:DNA-binding transcriptional LysR family regulator